jgi:hypothetical protein
MTNKEIAEIGRQCLNVRDYDRLHQLFDELDPPRPESGSIVRFISGDYGIATERGIVTASEDNRADFIPWDDVPIIKETPVRILADDEVAVKVPLVEDWTPNATAIGLYMSYGDSGAVKLRDVITRAEAEAREVSDD